MTAQMTAALKLMCSLALLAVLVGCASPPKTFRASQPKWSTIELREAMPFEEAWREVVDVLARDFDLEMVSKDGGYVRTAWVHNWVKYDHLTDRYVVRAIVKFGPNNDRVDLKTEARYLNDKQWIPGYDNEFLRRVKADIMGVVGRTTR